MRRTVLVAALVLAACSSSPGSRDAPHAEGDEAFLSSPPRSFGVVGAPAVGDAERPPDAGAGAPGRAIVEADLYVRRGTLLHVQNAWRGLQLVDVADPAAPSLVARVPLTGTPVGLYVVPRPSGDVALVASSDHLAFALDAATGAVRSSAGARLWAVDVANPLAPRVTAEIALEGVLEETRLVGHVLYTVSRTWPGWDLAPVGGGVAAADLATDATVIRSFDVSAPDAPVAVDVLELPAAGWSTHVHVTEDRITLARAGWGVDGPVTFLTAVDISDPGGALAAGAEVGIPGLARDRWGLDLDVASGTFRAVVQEGWNAGARLVVLDWADPAAPSPRAELAIEVPESVTAARFDGPRVYVVTARTIDPLWVIDASDPGAPFLAGHLEMPGQLDHVEPRGDRLLALGRTPEGGGPFQLQVSLLDVSDPSAPALLARRWFGPAWGFVPATPDDLRKAFQVLDAEGLVLVPFQGFDPGAWSWTGGTQLLTFSRDALALGGFVPHAGALKRAFSLGTPGKLGALSDERLQTIDAADPAAPVELASLDLARPVWEIAVANGAAAELSGDPWRGATELAVVPADDPEAAVPLARIPLAGSWGHLFRSGAVVWVLATDPWSAASYVLAVDLAEPAAPRVRGRLDLPAGAAGWWNTGAVQVGAALAVARSTWTCGAICESGTDLLVLDLADPDAPRLAATVPLPRRAWTSELRAVGTSVWFSQYAWVAEGPAAAVRYEVGRVDLVVPDAPVVHAPVNVPGSFFSAADDGSVVYTEEIHWPLADALPRTFLHALALTDRGTARLLASAELPGWYFGARRSGAWAYTAGVDGAGRGRLAAVSLASMVPAPVLEIEGAGGTVLAALGGKLFVSSAWPGWNVLVFGLQDPASPRLEQTVPTAGWAWEVVVEEGVAYLPAGPYGVTTIDLAP